MHFLVDLYLIVHTSRFDGVHMRDEHVDDISLHTHTYSNFLVDTISEELASVCPNKELECKTLWHLNITL